MDKKFKLYLYTFLGVGLTIFLIGYFGINFSLKYIQRHYIQLQIDVNKRQAERMAYYIKNEIRMGLPLDSIRNEFQASIVGTEFDKGFLCMYDTKQKQLVCHPDANALGVSFTKEFVFRNQNSDVELNISDLYSKKKPAGGIFVQGNMRTDIIYTIPIEGTNWFVNAHENINAISKEIKELRFRYILGSLLFGIIIAISASITARRININYEKKIEQKNVELQALNFKVNQQNEEISTQFEIIAKKNKEITDSIFYAEKIQSAVLPKIDILSSNLPESFVLYKPKDIISGDFYWFNTVNQYFVIVAADCTGHGVPGAFMSMLGIALLNEIINHRGILTTGGILNELRAQVKTSLGQSGIESEQKDGMDIAICIIDKDNKSLQYSGAFNPLYIVRKNEMNNNFDLTEIKADRMPIGVYPKDNQSFRNNEVQLTNNDCIYIFSDGYTSQFGGEHGDTFKSKRFQNLLLSIQHEPLKKHKEVLETTLANWQGKYEQVDDILVIGLKITA
jgi:serine phosphatase RsbU (regulator of sigma subunit)